jgi:hypothetical protein
MARACGGAVVVIDGVNSGVAADVPFFWAEARFQELCFSLPVRLPGILENIEKVLALGSVSGVLVVICMPETYIADNFA